MSDFVTVDEVGDVTDLPGSPGPAASPVPLQEATPSPDLSHTNKVNPQLHRPGFSSTSFANTG